MLLILFIVCVRGGVKNEKAHGENNPPIRMSLGGVVEIFSVNLRPFLFSFHPPSHLLFFNLYNGPKGN